MNCIFCFKRPGNRLSREHLFSNPICAFVGIERADTHFGRVGNDGTEPSIASLESLAVKAVCKKCNESWMSELEVAAAETFGELQQTGRLSAEQTSVLCRWLAKTHLMLCFIEGGSRRSVREPEKAVIPDASLGRALFENAELGSSTRMAIARRQPQSSIDYQFGTPLVRIGGSTPMGRGLTSASVIAIGPFVVATANFLLPAGLLTSPHQFPPLMTELTCETPVEQLNALNGAVMLEHIVVDLSSRTFDQIDQILKAMQPEVTSSTSAAGRNRTASES